jgi:hypothetical protein
MTGAAIYFLFVSVLVLAWQFVLMLMGFTMSVVGTIGRTSIVLALVGIAFLLYDIKRLLERAEDREEASMKKHEPEDMR